MKRALNPQAASSDLTLRTPTVSMSSEQSRFMPFPTGQGLYPAAQAPVLAPRGLPPVSSVDETQAQTVPSSPDPDSFDLAAAGLLNEGQHFLCTTEYCSSRAVPALSLASHEKHYSLFVGHYPYKLKNLLAGLIQQLCGFNVGVSIFDQGTFLDFQNESDRAIALETCADKILIVGKNIYYASNGSFQDNIGAISRSSPNRTFLIVFEYLRDEVLQPGFVQSYDPNRPGHTAALRATKLPVSGIAGDKYTDWLMEQTVKNATDDKPAAAAGRELIPTAHRVRRPPNDVSTVRPQPALFFSPQPAYTGNGLPSLRFGLPLPSPNDVSTVGFRPVLFLSSQQVRTEAVPLPLYPGRMGW